MTQEPREIRPSARAVANRIKQAAPANDPERRRSIRYARMSLARRTQRTQRGSGPKRLPSRVLRTNAIAPLVLIRVSVRSAPLRKHPPAYVRLVAAQPA